MPGARIECNWSYNGLRTIVLENEYLRLTILPELGGKIFQVIHKAADTDILWHHPRIEPQPVPFGSRFDDVWCGGWDEQFPNDEPLAFKGEMYPDHGELWSMPWDWQVQRDEPNAVVLYMRRLGCVTTSTAEKWITLNAGEPYVRIKLRITNTGIAPIDYIWKLHPAFAISVNHRIDLPAARVIVDEGYRTQLGGIASYTWPYAVVGQTAVDMRLVPPATAGVTNFHYVTELTDGWLAVTDTVHRFGFGLVFPKEIFRSIWLFLVYGGWRGLYTAVVEPATGYPSRLDQASEAGTSSTLQPGKHVEAEIIGVAYSGVTTVSHIAPDGAVYQS